MPPSIFDEVRVTLANAIEQSVIMRPSSLLAVFTTGKETDTSTVTLPELPEEERDVVFL